MALGSDFLEGRSAPWIFFLLIVKISAACGCFPVAGSWSCCGFSFLLPTVSTVLLVSTSSSSSSPSSSPSSTHHHHHHHQVRFWSWATPHPSWSCLALASSYPCLHTSLTPRTPCNRCLPSWLLAGLSDLIKKNLLRRLFSGSCWTWWKLPTLSFQPCCLEFLEALDFLLFASPAAFTAVWSVLLFSKSSSSRSDFAGCLS